MLLAIEVFRHFDPFPLTIYIKNSSDIVHT